MGKKWGPQEKVSFCYPKLYMNCLGFISLLERIPFGEVSTRLFVTRATVVAFVRGGPFERKKKKKKKTIIIIIVIMRW